MVDVGESVVVLGQDFAEKQGLGPVTLEEPQHDVVVGHELHAVHGPCEVELLQGLRRDLVQLRAGSMHDHPLQAAVGRAHAEARHERVLRLIQR